MATLANIFNQFTGAKAIADAAPGAAIADREAFRLRTLPNEDVYFYSKRIDNSRVMKQADPKAQSRDWKAFAGGGVAAAALIAFLVPSAGSFLAGYQLSHLQQENQRLQVERTRLELEEAKLVSTERLQQLAESQKFVAPAQDRMVYLPKNESSLALNRR